MVDEFFYEVDTDDSGEVDESELATAMHQHTAGRHSPA